MSILPDPQTVAYTVIVPTVYGQVLVNRYDTNQTDALIKSAQAIDAKDVALFGSLVAHLPPQSVVLDVGANFGLYTLACARSLQAKGGVVHAFEAQRMIAYMLAGTVALNSLENVRVHHVAVGAAAGALPIPAFDYRKISSFGSIEFGEQQKEFIGQPRANRDSVHETVPVITLDSLPHQNVGFVKIDIEGMEEAALAGAEKFYATQRPLTLIEWIKSDRESLVRFFVRHGYTVYLYGMNLFCQHPANLIGGITMDVSGLQKLS